MRDRLIAAGLLALAQAETWLAGWGWETALAAAVATIALAWRRRAPLAVAAVVFGALGTLGLFKELPVAVFLLPTGLLALYSVAAHTHVERAVVGLAIGLVMLAATSARTPDATVTDVTAPALMFAGAWGIGRAFRRRRLSDDARERAAAAAERRRIARELHDIVAHRVSTIVIQAEAGLMTVDEPGRPDESLTAIRDSGRQALGELRRLLDLLRDEDEGAPARPQPDLSGLAALADDARRAGLPVELRVDESPAVPPGTALAAYRIVQEGLTNALRHARTPTTVDVKRNGAGLTVEVRNPLAPGVAFTDGGGQGLAGMRERVRVFGGTLSATPEGDEFVLRATLPLEEP